MIRVAALSRDLLLDDFDLQLYKRYLALVFVNERNALLNLIILVARMLIDRKLLKAYVNERKVSVTL